MSGQRVALALSGGVDSSFAAYLLKSQGYDVFGLTMKLWPEKRDLAITDCRWQFPEQHFQVVRVVCDKIGIPFYIIDLSHQFSRDVIQLFCHEYERGRTPNPCVICNRDIKFGALLEKALEMGADYLATGHYAGITRDLDGCHLFKGQDSLKDQSYMLYSLNQKQLAHILFPLSSYRKTEVRQLSQQANLPCAQKADSQDVCFIQGDYRNFIKDRAVNKPGYVVDSQGKVLGKHRGIPFYTIGQRHGLGISSLQPLYVTKIDADVNTIVVGNVEAMKSSHVTACDLFWVSGKAPQESIEITAKIRYKSAESHATYYPEGNRARVVFSKPQRSVTPGQAVVFYKDLEVLGGGTIEEAS